MRRLGARMAAAIVLGVTVAPARQAEAMMQSARPASPCDSTAGRALPPPSFAPVALTGNYLLTLVARSGDRARNRAEGGVRLIRSDSSDRSRRPDGTLVAPYPSIDNVLPLYGWADVTLADVGAIASRDPRARDPIYPGVLVLVGPPRGAMTGWGLVLMQLGSGSRDGVQTTDEPTTAL